MNKPPYTHKPDQPFNSSAYKQIKINTHEVLALLEVMDKVDDCIKNHDASDYIADQWEILRNWVNREVSDE